jgi:hypothetical protein
MSNLSMRMFRGAVTFCMLTAAASTALAQASRTWVSGVGDDANPCSRTAPCKTFAGAISRTAAGGEISALDPGGYGAVTITKAITIDGGGGQVASILAAGTNGIIVNAGVNDVVILRNIRINGIGSGLNGIRFLAGGELHVQNCVIERFTNTAVDFRPGSGGEGYVSDTTLSDNVGGGVVVNSGRMTVSNLHAEANGNGVMVNGTAIATVRDSFASGGSAGFGAVTAGGVINVENSVVTHNTFGIFVSLGAVARVSNTMINSNVSEGLHNDGSSFLISLQGNSLIANPTNGSFTSTTVKQ